MEELKESEDERIRKEIIAFLTYYHTGQGNSVKYDDGWITWLEKQGKQKPADKVEPKFKVGDWIIGRATNNEPRQISEITDQCYKSTYGGQYGFSFEDEMHLWTIQDAKDGDVLASKDNKPFIYNGNYESFHIGSYCGITVDDEFKVATEKCHWTNNVNIHPATKEQRDLLFQKMKEAGYEWDANKKQLKKIEQKSDTQHSTEWSVSDFRTWQYIVSDVLTKKDGIGQYLDSGECKKIAKYMQEEWGEKLGKEQTQEELCKGKDYGIDGLYAAIDILQKTLGEVDGYQSDDGILEHKCAINAVKEFYKQKPAWSEEDEEIANKGVLILKSCAVGFPTDEKFANEFEIWIKSLKDRVQPKQEWSEEDAKALNRISVILVDASEVKNWWKEYRLIERDEMIRLTDFLKSLKPQTTWKPSDEQIEALVSAIDVMIDNRGAGDKNTILLSGLYHELKTL